MTCRSSPTSRPRRSRWTGAGSRGTTLQASRRSMLEVVTLAAVVAVALVMAAIETGPNRSRELALVAALAAAAAAGRVVFAAIPNVQPVTMIVAVAGISLGPRAGLATGAGAALASNAFLGQGPWTPWQMLGWGLVGVLGALLRRPLGEHPSALSLGVA